MEYYIKCPEKCGALDCETCKGQGFIPAGEVVTDIKRYDLEETGSGYMSYREMIERTDGYWIKYEDIKLSLSSREKFSIDKKPGCICIGEFGEDEECLSCYPVSPF